MQRYIKLYSDVLSSDLCNEMIEMFDANPEQQEVVQTDTMDFKQIKLFQHKETWVKFNTALADVFFAGLNQYKQECNIKDTIQWPTKYGFEEFRMKRYEPKQGKFDIHTDACNLETSKRFLAFFVYLNGGDDAGTKFPDLDIEVPRLQGSMLMFPPLWTYPHAGLMPIHAPKYIVGSYLHYTE